MQTLIQSCSTYLRILTGICFSLLVASGTLQTAKAEPAIDATHLGLWVAPGICRLDPWEFSTLPPEACPQVSAVIPGQEAQLIPWIRGNAESMPAYYRLRVLDANGELFFDSKRLPWHARKGRVKHLVSIPTQHVNLIFSDDDAPGEYAILLTFFFPEQDVQEIKKVITLRPLALRGEFSGMEDFEAWMHHYYTKPEPERALTSYLFLAPLNFDSGTPEDTYRLHILAAFYFTAMRGQSELLELMREAYGKHGAEVDRRILYALGKLGEAPPAAFNPATSEHKRFWEWANIHPFIPLEHITAAIQLDVLWAEFFASGRYEPVNKIIGCLQYRPAQTRREQGEIIDANTRQQAVLYSLARWSLSENLREHPLLRAYCKHALETHADNDLICQSVKALLVNPLTKPEAQEQ